MPDFVKYILSSEDIDVLRVWSCLVYRESAGFRFGPRVFWHQQAVVSLKVTINQVRPLARQERGRLKPGICSACCLPAPSAGKQTIARSLPADWFCPTRPGPVQGRKLCQGLSNDFHVVVGRSDVGWTEPLNSGSLYVLDATISPFKLAAELRGVCAASGWTGRLEFARIAAGFCYNHL